MTLRGPFAPKRQYPESCSKGLCGGAAPGVSPAAMRERSAGAAPPERPGDWGAAQPARGSERALPRARLTGLGAVSFARGGFGCCWGAGAFWALCAASGGVRGDRRGVKTAASATVTSGVHLGLCSLGFWGLGFFFGAFLVLFFCCMESEIKCCWLVLFLAERWECRRRGIRNENVIWKDLGRWTCTPSDLLVALSITPLLSCWFRLKIECSSSHFSAVRFSLCFVCDGYWSSSQFALPFILTDWFAFSEELYKLYSAYTFIFGTGERTRFLWYLVSKF